MKEIGPWRRKLWQFESTSGHPSHDPSKKRRLRSFSVDKMTNWEFIWSSRSVSESQIARRVETVKGVARAYSFSSVVLILASWRTSLSKFGPTNFTVRFRRSIFEGIIWFRKLTFNVSFYGRVTWYSNRFNRKQYYCLCFLLDGNLKFL